MLKTEIKTIDDLRVIAYEIEAEYIRGAENNGAYWTEIDFREFPPFPEGMNDFGDIGTWKHPAGDYSRLCYYFGCQTDYEGIPEGFVEFMIGGGCYAVVTASESVTSDSREETARKVRQAAAEAIADLAKLTGGYQYDIDHGMMFERYKDQYAYIYVPVKRA